MKMKLYLKSHPFVVYTILFCITALLTFSMFLVYDKTLVYSVDGFFQHYPMLVKLRHMMGDLLQGKGFSYWLDDVWQGVDTFGNFSIVLMDPFCYIAAAFPIKYIDIGYGFSVVLRMYTAGITMMIFLNNRKMSNKQMIIGGISYAFCSWSITASVHAFFLNPLILFPLIILGIDRVFENKKPYILIFSVVSSLVTYVYFAYMSAIFAIIYIIVKYIFEDFDKKNRSFVDFMKWVARFIGYVLISCLLSAIILIPMVYSILNASKNTGVDKVIFLDVVQALRVFPSLICNIEIIGNYSATGINAFLLIFVPVVIYNIRDRKTRTQSVLAVFSFVMVATPLWGSLMNGFSYPVGRWCYIGAFFIVWATTNCIENKSMINERVKKWGIAWVTFLFISLIVASVVIYTVSMVYVAIGCYTLFSMLFFLFANINKDWKLYLIFSIQIGLFYILNFSPFGKDGMSAYMDIGAAYSSYHSSLLRVDSQIDDDDFYRIDFIERIRPDNSKSPYLAIPANENIYWEARTIFSYLSTLSEKAREYSESIGNYGNYVRRIKFYSYDNRVRLNFLAGIKYFFSSEESGLNIYSSYGFTDLDNIDGVNVQKSNYNVGLGYVFDTAMERDVYEKYSELEKEQILMQNIVLDKDDIEETLEKFVLIEDNPVININEVECSVSDLSQLSIENNRFEIINGLGVMVLDISEFENSELYVQIEGLKKEPYTLEELRKLNVPENATTYVSRKFKMNYLSYHPYENFEAYVEKDGIKKRILNAAGEAQANREIQDYIVNLGYFDKVEGNINITFYTNGKYHYDSIKVYAVPVDTFDTQAKELSERRFTMTEQRANNIKGEVSTDKSGILYLSIPYSEGWKAYVDGEETNIYCADVCFMGIPVSEGKHEILLVYKPIGYPYSFVLFGIGVMIIAIMISIDIYRYKKRGKSNA